MLFLYLSDLMKVAVDEERIKVEKEIENVYIPISNHRT